ncbi:hypothetical protein BC629DRAFT_1495921 [Irpex lacteus]|nr:hypothetical protein BC629DRAFT_1495921 [Irpex lacteus]
MSELKTTKQSTLLRNRSAALSFDRSGTLPLMLYCTSTATPFPLPDIHRHRVRQLFLHNSDSDYMAQLISSTPSLDTLVICKHLFIARKFIRCKERWTIPSLKTLLSFRCSFWRFGSFGNLRHLVVEAEFLPDSSISSIFNVLAENPHLEDVVFVDVTAIVLPSQAERLTEYATILPIVHMRSLKRIKVTEAQGPTLAWLFDQKLTFPASVARDYTFTNPFYHLLDLDSPLVNAWIPFDPHPVKCFYISEDNIYATDGTSATHLSIAGDSQRGFFFTVFLQFFESETSELWLSLPDDPSFKDTSDWETILERLRGVTTLSLLLHGVTVEIWLGLLSSADRFFPLLTSLQIHHPKPEYHLRYIVFLMARRQSGHPIETLRFMGAPEAWKDGELRVSLEDLVGTVVFVDEGPLPKFELPAVCTTDSDVHAYWTKWEL